ncbi:hypothetical protein PHYBOEH_000684 [Phytophthora boehmeriae]|uniref:Myb-like DNA-binding protein n=1 Tax=Phytophthora boehmeriae TaxID=109152 RepID=A0A8T1WXD5_9STRA|nr:hypothetical protein PHYBOEH_000684 [Phytophthora boehmeriae]
MAPARPQLPMDGSDPAQTKANKKRKVSDASAAFRAASRGDAVPARCSVCGFVASTLDHLLTHVRESHDHSHDAETPQMVLPLEVAQMLVQQALDQAALGGATSAWLGALQRQHRATTELVKMVSERNPEGVAAALRKLHEMTPAGDEKTLWTTLQKATQILLQPKVEAAASPKDPSTVTIKMEDAATKAVALTDATTTQKDTHEAEAAQALTGLRGADAVTTSAAAPAVAAPAISSARPPAVPKSSPTSLHATFPSFPMGSPLSITAPPPPMVNPHFSAPELFTPGSARSPGTPSSLPSLFARRLLAPLASPSSVTDPGDRLAQGVAGMAYANSMLTVDPRAAGGSNIMMQDASPASLTPVYYPSFPVSAANAGINPGLALVATSGPARTTGASPVKRKSITSKQLSVRCDAEVAAARAAASAASSAPSGAGPLGKLGSLDALPAPGTPITPATRKANPRRWTKEEDDALRAAVENHCEKNWKAIAAEVPGRNHTQCLQRWTKVLAPGLVKGHWSPHEDDLLRRLVATEQKNWGDVAAKIPGRTSKQCRERWHNHLDPQIVRGAYTAEEDRLILEAQSRLGNRWSVIASLLPGRTEDAVKIRWKSHCRVWKARKYLRKNPNSDVDMLSEPAQTPRTPLVPPSADFKWPVSLPVGVEERESESSASKTSNEATRMQAVVEQ